MLYQKTSRKKCRNMELFLSVSSHIRQKFIQNRLTHVRRSILETPSQIFGRIRICKARILGNTVKKPYSFAQLLRCQ